MIIYTVEFDQVVSIQQLVNGGRITRVIDMPDIAAWERPIIKFEVPKSSRPGDTIAVRRAWSARNEYEDYDVVFTLVLRSDPPFRIEGNDVYIRHVIHSMCSSKVHILHVIFPNGTRRDVPVHKRVRTPLNLKFRREGLYDRRDTATKGDFYVHIELEKNASCFTKPCHRKKTNTCDQKTPE